MRAPDGVGLISVDPAVEAWGLDASVSTASSSTTAGGGAGVAAGTVSPLADRLTWRVANAVFAIKLSGALLHDDDC